MDLYSEENTSKLKPFSIQQVITSTALFGPLAGGFLISRTYKAIGFSNRAKISLVISIVMFLLACSVLYSLPENYPSNLVNYAFNALWTAAAYLVFHFDLSNGLKQYTQLGGVVASGGRAFLIGLIALVISFASIFGVEQLSNNLKYDEVAIYQKSRIMYDKTVDETRAQAVARVIRERNIIDDNLEADIILQNDGERYKLSIILSDMSQASSPEILQEFNELERGLNFNLNFKQHIDVVFVDPNLENEVKLRTLESAHLKNPFFYLYSSRRDFFYFGDLVSEDDVEKIEESLRKLKEVRIANTPTRLIYVYSDTGYILKFCVDSQFWDNASTIEQVKSVMSSLRSGGLTRKVRVVLYDYKKQREQVVKM